MSNKYYKNKFFLTKMSLKTVLLFSFLLLIMVIPVVSQSPEVLSPSGGEKIESGRAYRIEWANIRGSKVNISLISHDYKGMIARDVNNTGSFLWQVKCSLKGEDFIIWVMSTQTNSRARCDTFEIVSPRKIIAPQKGGTVKPGSKFIIKWKGFDCEKVRITLGQKDKKMTAHLALSLQNKGSFIWQVPKNYKGSNFYLIIRDVSKQSCKAISGYFYINPFNEKKTQLGTKTLSTKGQKILTHKPTKSTTYRGAKLLLKPRGGDVLKAGSPYEIKWTGLQGGPDIRIILIENKIFRANLSLDAQNTGSFKWNIGSNLEGSNFQIKVTGYPKNTKDYVISQPFTIILPPQVIKPNHRFTVRPGKKFMINWRNFKSRTLIIELWQGKRFKETINRSASNTNNYEWSVSSRLQGYGFQIKIKSTTKSDEFAFSESFKILN